MTGAEQHFLIVGLEGGLIIGAAMRLGWLFVGMLEDRFPLFRKESAEQ